MAVARYAWIAREQHRRRVVARDRRGDGSAASCPPSEAAPAAHHRGVYPEESPAVSGDRHRAGRDGSMLIGTGARAVASRGAIDDRPHRPTGRRRPRGRGTAESPARRVVAHGAALVRATSRRSDDLPVRELHHHTPGRSRWRARSPPTTVRAWRSRSRCRPLRGRGAGRAGRARGSEGPDCRATMPRSATGWRSQRPSCVKTRPQHAPEGPQHRDGDRPALAIPRTPHRTAARRPADPARAVVIGSPPGVAPTARRSRSAALPCHVEPAAPREGERDPATMYGRSDRSRSARGLPRRREQERGARGRPRPRAGPVQDAGERVRSPTGDLERGPSRAHRDGPRLCERLDECARSGEAW